MDDRSDWVECLRYKKAIDYPVHTYISSGKGKLNSEKSHVFRGVTINSIKFYDNEVQAMEGEQLDWIQDD